MTGREQRLVAAFTVLGEHLAPVIEEVLTGKVDAEGLALIANALRTIADDIDPPETAASDQAS